jgi:hypothetical protein
VAYIFIKMPISGGNPDFGVKHPFDYGTEEPLSEQVKVLMFKNEGGASKYSFAQKLHGSRFSPRSTRTIFSNKEAIALNTVPKVELLVYKII